MTYFYYKTRTWNTGEDEKPSSQTVEYWNKLIEKKNWRITQLSNGYYQTEFMTSDNTWMDVTRRQTLEDAESAIDSSIDHYKRKLKFLKGPIVVKTFE